TELKAKNRFRRDVIWSHWGIHRQNEYAYRHQHPLEPQNEKFQRADIFGLCQTYSDLSDSIANGLIFRNLIITVILLSLLASAVAIITIDDPIDIHPIDPILWIFCFDPPCAPWSYPECVPHLILPVPKVMTYAPKARTFTAAEEYAHSETALPWKTEGILQMTSLNSVCERVAQNRRVLAQLNKVDPLKLSDPRFLGVLITVSILIFALEPPLAPDDVTSKTRNQESRNSTKTVFDVTSSGANEGSRAKVSMLTVISTPQEPRIREFLRIDLF
ncbi:hypothetical protein PRIPAC_78851, partial [Pristionchus pacificus]|uniref:Uncharacterized protein n=1 Tax=Pristionchus pacificus TaxID=54126 RepID=A0A2A6CMM6_PRIPA